MRPRDKDNPTLRVNEKQLKELGMMGSRISGEKSKEETMGTPEEQENADILAVGAPTKDEELFHG